MVVEVIWMHMESLHDMSLNKTWVFLDAIEFHSKKELYKDYIDSYQRKIRLIEAIQTDTNGLNGILGSIGSIVGEKIICLVEYATNQLLPLIVVHASEGVRIQEGSLNIM
ncbi:Acetyl-coenzyme A carboxylase carboxyl transferase subunit beta, chloroplastic, partial [Mucuna pruriens]